MESYEYNQSQDDRRWKTVEIVEAVTPFLLNNGTGRLLVDPQEYDLWVSRGPPRQTDDSSIQFAELSDSLANTAEGTRRRYVVLSNAVIASTCSVLQKTTRRRSRWGQYRDGCTGDRQQYCSHF